MNSWSIIIIALGLAMDAFAVSIASGAAYRRLKVRHAFRLALLFGLFQGLMPIAGWLAGSLFREMVAAFDHWVAFILLAAVGTKMIWESFKIKKVQDNSLSPASLAVVLALAVATSIDALAVGVTLSLVTDSVLTAAAIIGLVTFILSLTGVYIGKACGHVFENKIEIAGGLVLIAIGLKILIEGLRTGL